MPWAIQTPCDEASTKVRAERHLSGGSRPDGIGTIAFQTLDGEPSWEASKAPGAHVKGAFKETVDPNIYVLEDESGNGVGWVHLAYSDAQGAGALYVRYGAGDLVEMRKVDRVPGYMRYDNERNT